MSFQPRHLASGRVCCSQEYALCDRCKGFRAAGGNDYTPPDPYAAGIAKMRGDTTPPKPSAPPTDYSAPDPYKADLEKLRRSEQ